MHIILFGTGCDLCREIASNIETVLSKIDEPVTFEKTSDLHRMLSFGIKSTPSVVIDDRVVSTSRSLSLEEIERLINGTDTH
ncbi:MAG: thioredoxin family protein [Sulfuricurvum sp.]